MTVSAQYLIGRTYVHRSGKLYGIDYAALRGNYEDVVSVGTNGILNEEPLRQMVTPYAISAQLMTVREGTSRGIEPRLVTDNLRVWEPRGSGC